MFHALPTKPAFLGPPPTTTTLSLLPPPSARPSTSQPDLPSSSESSLYLHTSHSAPTAPPQHPTKCALCAKPPKYTCPRCSMRTCSLPCSTAHKEKYTCTGIRRAEGYVSLREYGQGEWAEDYRYLEEGRRKIEGWGEGVKEEDLAGQNRGMGNQSGRPISVANTGGRGGAGGRGGGMAGRMRKSKTHNLQMELRARGVWTEYMPEGMGRRRLNQSGWNNKTGILGLTMQLSMPRDMIADEVESGQPTTSIETSTSVLPSSSEVTNSSSAAIPTIPKPPNPAAPSSSAPTTTFTADLRIIYHTRVLLVHPKIKPLPTLRSLLPSIPSSTEIVLLLPFFPSPARPAPAAPEEASSTPCRYFFPPLNPDLPLADVFKGTAWVEFPTVHIMPKDEWDKGLKQGTMGIVPLAQPRKRGADEMGTGVEDGGKGWGGKQDSGWGNRSGKTAPAAAGGPAKKKPKVARPDTAKEALGALGAYASDDDDDEEEGGDGVGEYMGMKPSELETVDDVEDGGIMDDDGVDDEDDVVFDQQPGGVGSLLAGLPPDLLVAMSHAIDADMA